MPRLANQEQAFVRPSPSGGTLGGVAARTREALLLCEAAGFTVVIVETVGAGQSETAVAGMVDFFLVLALPGAGDDLQGIKKGVLELADAIAVNKADGDNLDPARRAAADYRAALRIVTPQNAPWQPPVLLVSGLTGGGQDEVWQAIDDHRRMMRENGSMDERRRAQLLEWMWAAVDDRLRTALREDATVAAALPALERSVLQGKTSPGLAASRLLRAFGK
jgi:LAO/AO transport system kinase